MSSCANSYIDDNATYLWRHGYNVKNLCRCRQVRTGPKGLKSHFSIETEFYIYEALVLLNLYKLMHTLIDVVIALHNRVFSKLPKLELLAFSHCLNTRLEFFDVNPILQIWQFCVE